MRTQFQSHLDVAHRYWADIVQSGDVVIDATCGNGWDTLKLAELVGPQGKVYAYDIQAQAIESTRQRLQQHHMEERVQLVQCSHERFPQSLQPRLIVYNLGYLPGSDKTKTTLAATTLASLSQALSLLIPGGVISITAYPGHEEGAVEETAIQSFLHSLSPEQWCCTVHRWINRNRAPCLFLVQKRA